MSYRTFHANADTYEGPPPSVAERADDERYANEFNTIVATFRIALDSANQFVLTHLIARICDDAYVLSHEQPVIYFRDRYGYPAVLRALAKAIESPAHILGDLEGD